MKEFAGKKFLLVEENGSVPYDTRPWREALSLKEAGTEVFVICPTPTIGQTKEKFVVINGIHIYRYKEHFSNGTRFGYFKEYVFAFLNTLLLVHRLLLLHFPIHVIHAANPPDMFWLLGIYLKLFGIRFIFDEHDLCPETYLSRYKIDAKNAGPIYKIQKIMQKLSYWAADVIISTNQSYRLRAIRTNPGFDSKTFVVRNGPDTRYFKARSPNATWKKGRSYLGAFMGTIAVQDGVDYIIRAMDIIVNKKIFTDIIVYIIGEGDEAPHLKRLTHQLNLDNYIIFTGYIPLDQALEILSTADVCLSPDPSNPLNNLSTMNKLMDYMALGKAIVSFNLKEAKVSAEESAFYVENNSAIAFAEGILKLIRDPDLTKKMGEKGKIRIDKELCSHA